MNSIVDDPIKQDRRLASAVDRAQRILEEELGPSSAMVTAAWRLEWDARDQPIVVVKLSDFTGSAQDRFAPEELNEPGRLRARLYRLWGDLLQDRSDKQVAALKQLVGQTAGD